MKDGWREETTDGDEGHKFTAFFVLLYFYPTVGPDSTANSRNQ